MTVPTPRPEPLRLLGEGATSRVELARLGARVGEWPAGTEVAVKSLRPELARDETARLALAEELRAAAEARHPALVRPLFSGEDEAGPYLVLEFVPGQDLREHLDEVGPLPEPRVRSVGADLAGALAALHGVGRVHGDLKPENARLDDSGRTVLIDLGFARRVGNHPAGSDRAGTLSYLAPECLHGEPTTTAADVYSLGLTLYELATGRHPFLEQLGRASDDDATGRVEDLARLARRGPPPASSVVAEISPFFDQLIDRALSPNPHLRPSATELAARLAEGEAHPWWRERVEREEEGAGASDPPRAHSSPLVGREYELALLAGAQTSLRPASREQPARGAVVWIDSAAGCGKTRLVNEFGARARTATRPPMYLYCRASERRESRPLGTLLSLLRRWLQLPPGAAVGPRGTERLNRTVAPRDAEVLVDALGPSGGELAPALSSALLAWLRALSLERGVILFVDDLHRAGEATLSALLELAGEVQTMELLLVLGVRQEERPASPSALQRLRDRLRDLSERERPLAFTQIELGPLERSAVEELVATRFSPSSPRRRLAQLLWQRSLGNPGLLAQILRGLEARGDVRPESPTDPRWRLVVTPDAIPYPQSLETAIEERLEQLDENCARWLSRFSVIGGRISREFAELAFPGEPGPELDLAFQQLTAAGWLTSVGDRYRFTRPALREAVYERLVPELALEMHSRVADALVSDGEASWETVFHRAHHLRRAGRGDDLFRLLEPLFPRIPESGQPERVLTLARWAIEATERAGATPPERRLVLYEAAAEAADRLGRRDLQRKLLDGMIELELDFESRPDLAARVYLAHGRFSLGTGQLGLARGWLSNAERFAREAGDTALVCDALRRLSVVIAFTVDLDGACQRADEALALAPDPKRRAFAELVRARLAVLQNRIDDALASLAHARAELTALEEVRLDGAFAAVDMLRARVYRSAGRHGRAIGSASRAARGARRAGDRRLEVEALARLGGLDIDLGRYEDAEDRLRDARDLAIDIEDLGGRALAEMWLGILLWERDSAEAGPTLRRTVALADEIGHQRLRAVALAVLARERSAAGAVQEATELAREAFELLEGYGAELSDRVVIAGTWALLLESLGRSREARARARELRKKIRAESRAIRDEALRRSLSEYAERLLEAALSPDGPLYPRVRPED